VRRRLFWQIFGGFFLVTVVSTVVIGVLAYLTYNRVETDKAVRPVAEFMVDTLHLRRDASAQTLAEGAAKARELGVELAVFAHDGTLITETKPGLPTPADREFQAGFFHHHGHPGYFVDLPDGRFVSIVRSSPKLYPLKRFLIP
jgi:hypothetical protein